MTWVNWLMVFLVGGFVCMIGQILVITTNIKDFGDICFDWRNLASV